MTVDEAALDEAHPLTPSAASRAGPAIPRTAVRLRMITGYSAGRGGDPPRPPRSAGRGATPQDPPAPLTGGTHPPRPPLGGNHPPRPRWGGRWPPDPRGLSPPSAAVEGGPEQAAPRGAARPHRPSGTRA